jgi:DNA-binding SARP family transcriptional activator
MIRLSVLGALSLTREQGEGVDEVLAQPKVLALFVFLALARPRGFHQRDRLLGIFWPELPQEQARAALRKALHRLRAALGDECLASAGQESITVARTALWCDADVFEDAVRSSRYLEALEVYKGRLLPGMYVPGSVEFDQWLEGERTHLHDTAVAVAWKLVERYAEDQQYTYAARLARRVASLATDDERMVRKVMTMLGRLGDRAGTVRVFREFEKRLWNDVQLRPSAETLRLLNDLQSRSD